MGKLIDKYNLRQRTEKSVLTADIFGAFVVNNILKDSLADLRKLNGMQLPIEGEPEFTIKIIEPEQGQQSLFNAPQLEVTYLDQTFVPHMPESLFNYFCYLVDQYEHLQYASYDAIMDYYNKITKEKEEADTSTNINKLADIFKNSRKNQTDDDQLDHDME